MNYWRKKFGLLIITIFFVFVSVFGIFFVAPDTAKAQIVSVEKQSIGLETWLAKQQIEDVKLNTKEKMMLVAIGAITNGLNYFTNKIAYDMGVWLASGDWGQGPFASQKSFRDYLAQTAADSLGDIIGSMGEMIGINLCKLPDLRLHLALVIGFHFGVEPPEPRCTWQELREAYNVENIRSQYASQEGLMNRISGGIAVNDTDFGIWFQAKAKIDSHAREVSEGKKLDREEGSGINPKTDIISGKITVPAEVMAQEYAAQAPGKKQEKDQEINTAALGMAVQKGGISLAVNTAATFVNIFLGTVLKNFMEKGMLPGGKVICNPGMSISGLGWNLCLDDESTAGQYYSAGSAGGSGQRRVAQEMFSELLLPKTRTIENYDPTGNMAECSLENLAPDACIVDQSFLQAIQRGNFDQPLTIKQAIEQGLLHGDWKLYSSNNEAMNQKRDCALEGYCNRNLRMLRLLRIMPLGLEIASQMSPNGNEVTLKQVVDNYYNSSSAYYHLVNPYWIIKMPKTKCGSFAYSAVNYTDSPIRLQYCADIQHCVGFNTDGSCANWGYCLREKPIWNFNADYCDAENNTCLAFTASDKTTGSYLLRTLDTVSCNEENDGCRRYSQVKYYNTATNTDWFPAVSELVQSSNVFFNTSLYFNKQIPSCNNSDDGCSAFKLSSNPSTLIYLRKAPDYLGCYDADGSTGANKIDLLNKKLKNGIQWPVNFSDLNLINPQNKEACQNYAQVCLPEEENCNFYTSVLTKEIIPGKFTPAVVSGGIVTWNDQCDSKCVGYDTYREMPSNYSNGQLISYIIPASGRTCEADEVGCNSFTNLSTTAGGLEQNEYFTYLRLCILPDQNLQRNYTVYERSETKGYEIKTFTLVKSDESNGPKQIYRDGNEMTKYTAPNNQYCSETSYANKTAEPDCHQFIDEFGDTYYAMLSKTVIVSEQCVPYRLNNTELIAYGSEARCPFDFDNGANNRTGAPTVEFRNNACHYAGYVGNTNGAGDTISCSSNKNSCRAYKGNAGYNVRKLVDDDFENVSTTGWMSEPSVSRVISTESTQLDGHSLKISAQTFGSSNASFDRTDIILKKGKSYILSFWAKGNLPISQIMLSAADADPARFVNSVITSDVWRYYSFGPIEYNSDDMLAGRLMFYIGNTENQTKNLFIDNVILTEVEDYIYLVKDSLSVDPICDSNPNDNLPGEALGCSAYTDPIKTMYYLTNFSYLCREVAVGCTALLDTFNTPDDSGPRAYNVWLELKTAGQGGVTAKTTIDDIVYECAVPVGEIGCYTDVFGKTATQINSGGITADNATPKLVHSTVLIPADTPSNSPIYLVANKGATCKSENMGCQVVGRATKNISGKSYSFDFLGNPNPLFTHYETFEEVGIKNDPALYESTSCVSEAESCKSWTSGQSKYYFKDPVTNGGLICEYKKESFTAIHLPETAQAQPTSTSNLSAHPNSTGWVWKDTGICILESASLYMGRACATDKDCLIGNSQGKCLFKNQLPCYPKYRSYDGTYGLWSFGTVNKYNGFVGLCPSNQSGCNEFVDWSSSEDNKKCSISGKKCNADSDCVPETDGFCVVNTSNAYYLIDNTKLSTAQSQCNGQISRAEGCVLLDKTGNPNKYWNTEDSYELSRAQNDILVAPVDSGNSNDANIIIKVTQDRVCGEWAYCDLKQEYEDEDSGEIKNRCYHLGVCQRAGAIDSVVGRVVKDCAEPVVDWDTKGKTLSSSTYKNFMTAWDSWDFAGYSVYGVRQVPDITARKIVDTYRMVYVDNNYSFLNTSSPYSCYNSANANKQKTDGELCGSSQGTWGYCYNGECMRGYNTKNPASARVMTCRAYAEEMSPFPNTVLKDYTRGDPSQYKAGFEDVNLCYNNNGDPVSCDYQYFCSYRKLKTSSGEVYKRLSTDQPVSTNYVCSSGPNKGKYCSGPESTQCGEEGICSKINSFQLLYGWPGYCLERDERQRINGTSNNTCLTWWPLESPPGMPNYWEDNPKAGYQINEGREDRYMCLENNPIKRYYTESRLETLIINTGDNDAVDYTFQEYPKHIQYGAWPSGSGFEKIENLVPGEDKKIKINLIPQNAAVMGCYNEGSYEWYLYTKEDSAGVYCPVNRNTVIYADATMKDKQDTGINKIPPQQLWSEQGQKYIHRDEIERIDVFIDATAGTYSNGWVSFINDVVDTDEVRRFVVQQHFASVIGEYDVYTQNLESESFGSQLTGWSAWSFAAGVGSNRWTIGAKALIPNFFTSDSYHKVNNQDSSYENDKKIGVRIVFDNERYLRGIWLNLENGDPDSVTMGYVFIIHFNHGACKKFEQVSTSSSSVKFGFKPFTNNLRSGYSLIKAVDDCGGYSGSSYCVYSIAGRNDNESLNGGHYGLAWRSDAGYANVHDPNAKIRLINPFSQYRAGYSGPLAYSQDGDINNNYGELGFSAGVPLIAFDNRQFQVSTQTGYNPETLRNGVKTKMLTSMYAKIYGEWKQEFADNKFNGYSLIPNTVSDYARKDQLTPKKFPPEVAAPSSTAKGGWERNAISVNGQTSGNIYMFTGSQARIKFYAWAHGNQMPIRRIVVEGGGGNATRIDTDLRDSIGNRKYLCAGSNICSASAYEEFVDDGYNWRYPCNNNDDCAPLNPAYLNSENCLPVDEDRKSFGNTTDTGCKDKPWNFVMDYNCPFGEFEIVYKNSQPSSENLGMPIDWNYIRNNLYDAPYVCVARPKVHVLDNWGWCTGDCETASGGLASAGCYSETSVGDCDIKTGIDKPWIHYDGYVVVVPLVTN